MSFRLGFFRKRPFLLLKKKFGNKIGLLLLLRQECENQVGITTVFLSSWLNVAADPGDGPIDQQCCYFCLEIVLRGNEMVFSAVSEPGKYISQNKLMGHDKGPCSPHTAPATPF